MSRHSNLVLLTGSKFPTWLLNAGGQRPKLDIDFTRNLAWNAAPSSISSLLSCTRATPAAAYYTKADGTLTTFAANILRYGTNGLLVEEARTNPFLRSQEFDNAGVWTLGAGAVVVADQATAPDGTLTADKVTTGLGAGGDIAQTPGTSANAVHTFSAYLKAGSGVTWVFFNIQTLSVLRRVWFNLSTGVVGTQTGASGTSQALANGWYRFTATSSAAITLNEAQLTINPVDSDGATNFTGADQSQFYYAWGAQMEAGAFATSYIPTTTVSVTRAADIVTFSNLTWFDGTNDSIYAEWVVKNVNNAKVWAFDATNDKLLDEQTGMSARIVGATVANTASAAATVKAAARMALNDFALSMNGGTVATDVSETAPGTLTASRLGVDLSGNNSLNSYIRRVAAFKGTLLGNSALQGAST